MKTIARTTGLALALLAGTAFAADAGPLEGKWEVISVERDGKADDTLKGAIRVHTGGKYTLTPKEGKPRTGTFVLDAAKTPKSIDLMPAAGQYKGKTLLGIYELDGDTLKICFAEPGKERPTAFTAKAGSGTVLAVHKRAKP